MKKIVSEQTEEAARGAVSLAMLVVGWIGVQGFVFWSLAVELTTPNLPKVPGTLPGWTGPVALECLLFAITGALIRSRMRLGFTVIKAISAVLAAVGRRNSERPPTSD